MYFVFRTWNTFNIGILNFILNICCGICSIISKSCPAKYICLCQDDKRSNQSKHMKLLK